MSWVAEEGVELTVDGILADLDVEGGEASDAVRHGSTRLSTTHASEDGIRVIETGASLVEAAIHQRWNSAKAKTRGPGATLTVSIRVVNGVQAALHSAGISSGIPEGS